MADYDALLQPLTIKNMTVRNRVISSSHGPGYVVDGRPTERLIRYHAEKAKGGIGLTQVGASAVSLDSPSGDYGIIRLTDDSIVDHLRPLVDAVHAHGAAVMIQLIHMGRRMRWDGEHWVSLIAPTVSRERVLRGFPKEMEDFDYRRVIDDFAQAARRCKAAGFDGIEVHGAGLHLIDQHWSPLVNKRTDEYGGGFENRMRFGVEVFEAIREEVGDGYVVGTRISGDEMIEGGSTPEECLDIARYYTERGLVDFLSVLGGSSTTHRHYAAFIPNMSLPPAPFLYLASAMRQEVGVPIFHAQRIMDLPTAARAVAEGHVDLACMTRAHIADPHMVRKLTEGREEDIRPCVGASYCVNRVGIGQDALCMYNVATSREEHIPHEHARAPARRKVVVVGAGPGGLEAARVAGERGHDVVLFEAAEETGGQLALAARVPWREALAGASRWQEAQARKHGVDIRLGTEATAEAVLAADPDVVILATGGRPSKGDIAGVELAVTTWDVLAGTVAPGENVLVYDDSGRYPAVSAVEVLAGRGAASGEAWRAEAARQGGAGQPRSPGGGGSRHQGTPGLHPPSARGRRGDDPRLPPAPDRAPGEPARGRPRQRIYRRGGGAAGRPGGGGARDPAAPRPLPRAPAPRDEPGRDRPARSRAFRAPDPRYQSRGPVSAVPHRRRALRPQRACRRL